MSCRDNDLMLFCVLFASPMYYNDYDVTAVLGGEVYDGSGDIDSATATKITWFIQGDDSVSCLLFNF
jgi:hypothetical protein